MAKQTNQPQGQLPALLRKDYWRSLEELHSTPAFRENVRPEFAEGADSPEGVNRRDFMKLLGASTALAGLSGCAPGPNEKIMPYTVRPPDVNPGLPLYYATSMVLDGFAQGLLVKSTDGRPTKVEGNPDHSATGAEPGAEHAPSSLFAQASVLSLYDPDRARGASHRTVATSRERLLKALQAAGPKLRFVLEPQSSPFVGELLAQLTARYPESKVTFYSPLSRKAVYEGARLAYGQAAEALYDFSKADVVLSLDADFTAEGPNALRYARQFADRRRAASKAAASSINRLYVAEPTPSPTGSLADHRLRLKPSAVRGLAAAVLQKLLAGGLSAPGVSADALSGAAQEAKAHDAWISAVAKDLASHAGKSIVVAGENQPAVVHALAHAINAALGNVGQTVTLVAPALLAEGGEGHPLKDLAAEIKAKAVDAVVIFEGNPSYNAPAELGFSELLRGAKNTFYFGLYENETARDCEWFATSAHYLESWGDARSVDGTVSLVQPLIETLYGGTTLAELLYEFLAPGDGRTAYQRLRSYWATQPVANSPDAPVVVPLPELNFQARWDEYLQTGVIPGSASPALSLTLNASGIAGALGASAPAGLELHLMASQAVYDGRFANNGWLQEWPQAMTKLTWDTAALVSPKTAESLGVPLVGYNPEHAPLVKLSVGGREVEAPLFILPGHADEVVSINLGYGRTGKETSIAAKAGRVNAYVLRTEAASYFAGGLKVELTGEEYLLAVTQGHWSMATEEGRPVVAPMVSVSEYQGKDFDEAIAPMKPAFVKSRDLIAKSDTDSAAKEYGVLPVPMGVPDPMQQFGVEQWAMTIDTSVCNGCSACIVACQAENNIAIVGKEGVKNSREMHWLRIDRYFVTEGPEDEPTIVNQPMACQHCEKASCEYVCPVNATVHSSDGLNEMIYNRCIGTRFCLNNCPYKARRFNFFNYVDKSSNKMVRNPQVTVRARGVMEKCSYCVQRIRQADIRAQVEGRQIRDGEVVTACQQACPTRAISFGSLRHKESEVVKWREQDKSYVVLNDLGNSPRTQYLTKITNPNPELAASAGAGSKKEG